MGDPLACVLRSALPTDAGAVRGLRVSCDPESKMRAVDAAVLFMACPGVSQAATIVPVTGLRTGVDKATGEFPARQRLQDLQKSGPAWYDLPEDLLSSDWIVMAD